MPYPEPKYISLKDAADKLGCSIDRLLFFLAEKLIPAYAPTPSRFPPQASFGEDPMEFTVNLSYFWKQKFDVHCQICPPFSWDQKSVKCRTIILTGEAGISLTRTDFDLSKNDGEIGMENEVTLKHNWWHFPKKHVVLTTQDVGNFQRDHTKNLSRWAIDANFGQLLGEKATPHQILDCGSTYGKSKKEIVAMIDAIYTGEYRLTNKTIGLLFSKIKCETDPALEQRGKRLRGKMT